MPTSEMAIDLAPDLAAAKGIALSVALGSLLYLNLAMALWEGFKLL
jgi:hypothetical protein